MVFRSNREPNRLWALPISFLPLTVVSYREVLTELLERDRRDSTREASPLKAADDAVRVDTTDMDIAEMIDALASEVARRGKGAT